MLEVMLDAREAVVALCNASAAVLGEYPTMEDMETLGAAIPRMIATR